MVYPPVWLAQTTPATKTAMSTPAAHKMISVSIRQNILLFSLSSGKRAALFVTFFCWTTMGCFSTALSALTECGSHERIVLTSSVWGRSYKYLENHYAKQS